MALKYEHSLLMVDDEVSITKALYRLFRREGYKIDRASGGEEALTIMKAAEKPHSLIISDQRMPGMTGSEFLEQAKKVNSDSIRILLTGYADMDAVVDAVNKGEIHRYMTKPWDDEAMKLAVQQSLEQFELVLENERLMKLTQEQNEKLNTLNASLEQRVAERTKAIFTKNKELMDLTRELEANLFHTVRALISLTEIHYPVLAGHGRRVSALAREIAEYMKLSDKETTHIEIAGLLHDIGKLGLSKKILEYRTREWAKEDHGSYERHPEESQEILHFVNRLQQVGQIVRGHHEWYDGGGFPDCLAEDKIPLGARILAVANAYDKIVEMKIDGKTLINDYLRGNRNVDSKLPEELLISEAAIYYLKKSAFTLFDPDVVKTFTQMMKEKHEKLSTEVPVALEDLKPGMVLTRPIYSSKGRFLLSYNTPLTQEKINHLLKIDRVDPIGDSIFVKKTPEMAEALVTR